MINETAQVDTENLKQEIRSIRDQLRQIGIQVMDAQAPFAEPRTSIVSAIGHLNNACERVENL